jgi:hypothetical protein
MSEIRKKRRSANQVKEENSLPIFRSCLPDQWVTHSYGSDYGIDLVVELFDYLDEKEEVAETLGENIFIQLKSSKSVVFDTVRVYGRANVAKAPLSEDKSEFMDIPVAKFKLETSELSTVQSMGIAIPVMLILVDLNTSRVYFVCLNDYIDKILIPEDPEFFKKDTKTIYIPLTNELDKTEESLVALRCYAKRAKMLAAFAKFSYQKKEIERALGLAAFKVETTREEVLSMIRTFVESSINLDIWKSHEFWAPIGWSHNELLGVRRDLLNGIPDDQFDNFMDYCLRFIWHRLTNLSNMYEELVREWFLPSVLAVACSCPPSQPSTST